MKLVTLITILSILSVYSAENCNTPECALCDDTSVCNACSDGYYLESGNCITCPSTCLTCTHSLLCQTCVASYWNPGGRCNNPCTDCASSDCEDTDGRCYECNAGRYGTECDKECSLCINGECDRLKCTNGCIDGYIQYKFGSGYSDCFRCTANCIQCSNTTYCTQCEQGFYGHYYRIGTGRGRRECNQCQEECTQCTSIDQCPECNTECIKQGCDVSGSCITTQSTPRTSAPKSPTRHVSTEITQPATTQTACPVECMEGCDVHGKCLHTTTRYSKSEGSTCICTETKFYEGFGYGIATGIGIVVAIGALIGIGVNLRRRLKCYHTMCPTKTPKHSHQQHVYVNTQDQPASDEKPEYEDVEANSDIRVSMSKEEVDADREYISLGERHFEHNYSGLQKYTHDGQ